VNEGLVGLGPYTVNLDYDYWNFSDIFQAILPEEEAKTGEAPEGFTQTGHVCKCFETVHEFVGVYKILTAGSASELAGTMAPV
jgi:hypothetical protein